MQKCWPSLSKVGGEKWPNKLGLFSPNFRQEMGQLLHSTCWPTTCLTASKVGNGLLSSAGIGSQKWLLASSQPLGCLSPAEKSAGQHPNLLAVKVLPARETRARERGARACEAHFLAKQPVVLVSLQEMPASRLFAG